MGCEIRGVAAMIAAVFCPLAGSGDTDAWVPAVSMFGGVITEKWDVSGDSDARVPFSGHANSVVPFVGFSAELMTPTRVESWGKPRLFVHGDIAIAFDAGRNTAKEGSQGKVGIPIIDFNMDGIPDAQPSVISATGTGSTARHEAEPLRLSAGLGVAFELELLGRTLRLRPSVEYQWQETETRLFVGDAESLSGGLSCPCRILQLASRETHSFHGIGPGLELELDAGRLGPFGMSVFGGIQGYRELGERRVRMRVNDAAFDDGKPASAEATFERDAWSFNGTVGLRFRWLPEDF
jgi:hypothetical protein